nr:hypothetical protein [Tanacetum cinerariifolium]
MNERCSVVFLNKLPLKEKDPKSFTIPCQVLEKHKEAEDLAVYHLSRFKNPHMEVLTERVVPPNWTFEERKRCVDGSKTLKILAHFHSGPIGGYHSANITAKKVEAQVLPTNDAHVVVKFLRSAFARFGVPKALISDRGAHFYNSHLEKALQRYGVTHKLSMAYHPQSNGQTKVTNQAIKRILERSIGLRSDKDFKVGDKVLLYNFRLKMYPEKLKSKWSGLNIVKRVYPYGAVEINDRDGFNFKLNGQQLKKYYEGNIKKEDDEVIEFENDWVSDEEPEAPDEAPQSPAHAPPSLDYMPGPKHPPSPDYVPGPEYPEYVAPSDDEEDEDETYKEDKEEENLASANSTTLPIVDPVPSAKDTEAFKTAASEPTPPLPRLCNPKIYVRPQTPMVTATEALIVAIPSPPLPLPSPPLPLHAPSSHLPLLATDSREDILEADVLPPKRLYLTAPASRFKVGESSEVIAVRHPRLDVTHTTNYSFVDTVDATRGRPMSREVGYGITNVWDDMVGDMEERASITLTRKPEPAKDPEPQDGPSDAGSSCCRDLVSLFSYLKMLPKRTTTTTTPMTDAAIEALIAQGVATSWLSMKLTEAVEMITIAMILEVAEGQSELLVSALTTTS